jgi:hypothetical protein
MLLHSYGSFINVYLLPGKGLVITEQQVNGHNITVIT